MKRLLIPLIILITIFLYHCESERVIPGETGIPVYLVPEVETSSDTLGCTFSWSFIERPMNSNLSILSFQPSSNGYNIYFIPDVPGDYKVKCEVLTPDQKLKSESVFLCKIAQNADDPGNQPLSGTVSDEPTETAEETEESIPDPIYLDEKPVADEKPADEITETKTPPPPKPRPQIPMEEGLFTIQISSFKNFANAEQEMKELKKMGLQDVYIKKVYIEKFDEIWYRVRTNTFPDRASAVDALNDIKTKYNRKTAWIDKIN